MKRRRMTAVERQELFDSIPSVAHLRRLLPVTEIQQFAGQRVLLPSGREGIVIAGIRQNSRLHIRYTDEPAESVALKRELVRFLP